MESMLRYSSKEDVNAFLEAINGKLQSMCTHQMASVGVFRFCDGVACDRIPVRARLDGSSELPAVRRAVPPPIREFEGHGKHDGEGHHRKECAAEGEDLRELARGDLEAGWLPSWMVICRSARRCWITRTLIRFSTTTSRSRILAAS